MKKFTAIIISVLVSAILFGQNANYSIEYETHKVGVFNPQWEIDHTLNPNKYEHITGYFREELAETIIKAVKQKKVKIYDNRKRELNIDTVCQKIIAFERQQGTILDKNNVWNYIIAYISAYDFEEAITYNYPDLSIKKKVISYCPYIVHYKEFNGEKNDSVQFPLFWIFPKDTLTGKNKELQQSNIINIPDTVLSVLNLKYPVKMPFTSSLFDNIQNKKIKAYRSDGSEFKTPKETEDLFVRTKDVLIYDEDTGEEKLIKTYSDIIPEDIEGIRIGENWSINPENLEIKKTIRYFLPLIPYDEDTYSQLGIRIWVEKND